MLRWRVLLGTILIAAMIGLCWLDNYAPMPGLWLLPLAIAAALMATQETLGLAAKAGMRPLKWPIYCGNLLLVLANWMPVRWPLGSFNGIVFGLQAVLAALAAGVWLIFFCEICRYRKPGGNMANIAGGIFALIYVGLLLSFAVQLRLSWGIAGIATWVIVVKMGDTGAYTVGRLIGRHKMAPAISPGKTIEGAFGAVLFSCVGAWAAFRWLAPAVSPELHLPPDKWCGWLVFGVVVGLAGLLGDLAESLLKRDVGVKDSSRWLPGFGGVLDILDSLLLSAPVAWFCWAVGLVGK
jgi:phosphatidate cytidylyltransferase